MKFPGVRAYPKEIYIKKAPWSIRFVKGGPGDPGNIGLCDPSDKTIYIKLGIKPVEVFKTFIHEILHSIEDEYCLTLPHSAYVYKMEEAATDFILQNFDVIMEFIDIMASRNVKKSD